METKIALSLRDVSFGYQKGQNVLEGISLTLEKGKIYGVLGGNGCGKSTLFRLISKQLTCQTGEILLNQHQ